MYGMECHIALRELQATEVTRVGHRKPQQRRGSRDLAWPPGNPDQGAYQVKHLVDRHTDNQAHDTPSEQGSESASWMP